MKIIIRDAVESDARAIHDIYGYYVDNTNVTFSTVNGSVEEYEQKIAETKENYPFYVAEDETGKILGFVYGSQLRHHEAYRYNVESTLYLAPDAPKRQGLGTTLYMKFIEKLKEMGYKSVFGVITDTNEPSICLHKKLGFTSEGHFKNMGFKNNTWLGIHWMRLVIGKY